MREVYQIASQMYYQLTNPASCNGYNILLEALCSFFISDELYRTPSLSSIRLLEPFHTYEIYTGCHGLRCQPRPHVVMNHTPRLLFSIYITMTHLGLPFLITAIFTEFFFCHLAFIRDMVIYF